MADRNDDQADEEIEFDTRDKVLAVLGFGLPIVAVPLLFILATW